MLLAARRVPRLPGDVRRAADVLRTKSSCSFRSARRGISSGYFPARRRRPFASRPRQIRTCVRPDDAARALKGLSPRCVEELLRISLHFFIGAKILRILLRQLCDARAPRRIEIRAHSLVVGKIDVVAPSSAPMFVIVPLPVQLMDAAPGPKYSMIRFVPPSTVRIQRASGSRLGALNPLSFLSAYADEPRVQHFPRHSAITSTASAPPLRPRSSQAACIRLCDRCRS